MPGTEDLPRSSRHRRHWPARDTSKVSGIHLRSRCQITRTRIRHAKSVSLETQSERWTGGSRAKNRNSLLSHAGSNKTLLPAMTRQEAQSSRRTHNLRRHWPKVLPVGARETHVRTWNRLIARQKHQTNTGKQIVAFRNAPDEIPAAAEGRRKAGRASRPDGGVWRPAPPAIHCFHSSHLEVL